VGKTPAAKSQRNRPSLLPVAGWDIIAMRPRTHARSRATETGAFVKRLRATQRAPNGRQIGSPPGRKRGKDPDPAEAGFLTKFRGSNIGGRRQQWAETAHEQEPAAVQRPGQCEA